MLSRSYKLVSGQMDRRWRRLKVYAIDGTKLTLPRSVVSQGYRLPHKSYYPQATVSTLYDVLNQCPAAAVFSRHYDERRAALALLRKKPLGSGDVVIYDRGYPGQDLLAAHAKGSSHFLMRCSRSSFKEVNNFGRSGELDKVVTITVRGQELPVRLISYRVGCQQYVLITSLTDKSRFPRRALKELYRLRWRQEEGYKQLKSILEAECFRTDSIVGVRQELYIRLTLQVLIRQQLGLPTSTSSPRRRRRRAGSAPVALILVASSLVREGLSPKFAAKVIARTRQSYLLNRKFERRSKKPSNAWALNNMKRRQSTYSQGAQP